MKTKLDNRTLVAIAVTLLCGASALAGIYTSLVTDDPGQRALLRFLVTSAVLAIDAAIVRIPYPIWAGTAFLLPLSLFPNLLQTISKTPLKATLAASYLGIFPHTIANGIWAYVLSQIPTFRTAMLLYLVPVLAIFVAWVWLQEVPTLLFLMGGATVLAGVILVNSRRSPEKQA